MFSAIPYILVDAEIPKSSGKAKVIRKKAAGDWRHWFTEEDVSLFKPAYKDYMQLMDYDIDDWNLNENPVIHPEYSSAYMQNLAQRAKKSIFKRYLALITRRFTSGSGGYLILSQPFKSKICVQNRL